MKRSGLRRAGGALALCLACLPGCGVVGDYLLDRSGDFSQIVRVEVGWPAVGIHVDATPLASTGLDLWLAGPPYGGVAGNYQTRRPEQGSFVGYSVVIFHARGLDPEPDLRDPDDLEGFSPPYSAAITHIPHLGYTFDDRPNSERLELIHWLDVEVDAALGVGVRTRVSPGQLLDFVLGWFGLDPGGDDRVSLWSAGSPGNQVRDEADEDDQDADGEAVARG